MASDYPSKIVLIGYFLDNQDAGSDAERLEWSDDTFDMYDSHIVAAFQKAGQGDPSAEARAIMAVMAGRSPGAGAATRAKHAVAAYLTYRGF